MWEGYKKGFKAHLQLEKSLSENHKLWKAVKDSKMLDMVPTNEIGRIEEYMEKHGVEPLFATK